ncbi:MAG: hypothetical protein ACLP22_20325 [Solirubrobacteraceae bacterium]
MIKAATPVATLAVLLPSAAFALKRTPIESGSYSGTTAQAGQSAGSVQFSVTKNLRIVKGFAGDVWATCTKDGAKLTVQVDLSPSSDMSVHKRAFGYHGVFDIDDRRAVIAKHVDGTITGTFDHADTVTGTMSFTWSFDKSAPAPFPGQHCSTGKAGYKAKRR